MEHRFENFFFTLFPNFRQKLPSHTVSIAHYKRELGVQVKFTQVTFKRTLKFGAVLKKPWEKILDNTTKKKEKEKRFRVRVDRKDYYLKINF